MCVLNGLFYETISITVCIATTDELERIWKETEVDLIGVLSRNLPGGNEKAHDKPVGTAGVSAEFRIKHIRIRI
jgi:hypothetical protein